MELSSQRIQCDALIIGAGAAALVAALEARKSLDNVVVVCKRKAGRCGNTIVAGAGFSACVPDEDNPDTMEQHLQDTLESGDGINDPALVRTLISEAAEAVMGLEQYGVRFMRANGQLVRRRPPGHSRPRQTPTQMESFHHALRGLSITLPLLKAAQERDIKVLSEMPVHRLLVHDGVTCGALATDNSTGAPVTMLATAVVLAAGGGGRLFAQTNNTLDMTGDAYYLALEAGVPLRDMEFVQFYPSQMIWPIHLGASSGLFGEGAVLRNCHGEMFMSRYDPAGDMATRDAMSQAIIHEVVAGNGVNGGVYMDCSTVPAAVMRRKFPTFVDLMATYSVDLGKDWLVVSPATHHLMGGAWIDDRCQTNVAGLFVAGEAAGGTHGANRLAGNALTETVVFGARAGREVARYVAAAGRSPRPTDAALPILESGPGTASQAEVRSELRRAMWEDGSIVRSEAGLRRGQARLGECLAALSRCRLESPADATTRLEIERMARAGQAVLASALARKESRGAHYRSDYRDKDDAHWFGSTRVEQVDGELRTTFVPLTK